MQNTSIEFQKKIFLFSLQNVRFSFFIEMWKNVFASIVAFQEYERINFDWCVRWNKTTIERRLCFAKFCSQRWNECGTETNRQHCVSHFSSSSSCTMKNGTLKLCQNFVNLKCRNGITDFQMRRHRFNEMHRRELRPSHSFGFL